MSSAPSSVLVSSLNCTPAIPCASLAEAEMSEKPLIVEPSVGVPIVTVGALLSTVTVIVLVA